MIGIYFNSLRIGDVLGDGSSRYFLIYLLLIPENMFKSLANDFVEAMWYYAIVSAMVSFNEYFKRVFGGKDLEMGVSSQFILFLHW